MLAVAAQSSRQAARVGRQISAEPRMRCYTIDGLTYPSVTTVLKVTESPADMERLAR